jgi:hypothetical protein
VKTTGREPSGAAAIPCTGLEESADGNAVGLPHLQPAALDPPEQVAHNNRSHLREYAINDEERGTHSK